MRIEADQLCVDYNGTVALYDASLRLPEGCICGLVGMNGAGKSTLFKALTGFVRPSRGRIRINGATVAQAQRQQGADRAPPGGAARRRAARKESSIGHLVECSTRARSREFRDMPRGRVLRDSRGGRHATARSARDEISRERRRRP